MTDKHDAPEPGQRSGDDSSGAPRRNAWFWNRPLPLETETSFFILANVLDIVMTFLLLYTGRFRESNEVANLVLMQLGSRGLIAFKLLIVTSVCVIAQVIAVKNEPAARRLLVVGAGIVFLVVIYSAYLYFKYATLAVDPAA